MNTRSASKSGNGHTDTHVERIHVMYSDVIAVEKNPAMDNADDLDQQLVALEKEEQLKKLLRVKEKKDEIAKLKAQLEAPSAVRSSPSRLILELLRLRRI